MQLSRGGLGAALAAIVVGGCMSASMGTGLQQLTPDTYRLSRVDGAGRYADAAAMKAALVDEANAFASKQGKTVVPISDHEETLRGHLLTAEYEFRLAAPGEAVAAVAAPPPQAAPVPPRPVADTTPVAPATAAEPAPTVAALPTSATMAPKPDFYSELLMLDDLRKRGILTDAEFQALKTKLIADK